MGMEQGGGHVLPPTRLRKPSLGTEDEEHHEHPLLGQPQGSRDTASCPITPGCFPISCLPKSIIHSPEHAHVALHACYMSSFFGRLQLLPVKTNRDSLRKWRGLDNLPLLREVGPWKQLNDRVVRWCWQHGRRHHSQFSDRRRAGPRLEGRRPSMGPWGTTAIERSRRREDRTLQWTVIRDTGKQGTETGALLRALKGLTVWSPTSCLSSTDLCLNGGCGGPYHKHQLPSNSTSLKQTDWLTQGSLWCFRWIGVWLLQHALAKLVRQVDLDHSHLLSFQAWQGFLGGISVFFFLRWRGPLTSSVVFDE